MDSEMTSNATTESATGSSETAAVGNSNPISRASHSVPILDDGMSADIEEGVYVHKVSPEADNALADSEPDSDEDDDDEPSASDWILYRDRAEWTDVTPVEQDDGPYTVVRIKYSEIFKDAYDYFRAILKTGEKSARSLELVTSCCRLNPSNYTAWTVRRDILRQLGSDLRQEMKFIEEMIVKQPKNYQVWHHRRALAIEIDDGSDEARLTSRLLEVDPKNYHAWQHRQFCIQRWSLWDGELTYTTKLISEDVRNNSAWNHRFVVLKATGGLGDKDRLENEIRYAAEKVRIVPANESAWSYLRGLLKFCQVPLNNSDSGSHPVVESLVADLIESGCRQAQLMSFQLDSTVERYKKERGNSNLDPEKYALLASMCAELATKHDTIRSNYWTYYAKKLAADFHVSQ